MATNTKYVGRPSKWGNPFIVLFEDDGWCVKDNKGNYWGSIYDNKIDAVIKSCECFGGWIDAQILMRKLNLEELRQYENLACFCPLNQPCHADILLKLLETPLDSK